MSDITNLMLILQRYFYISDSNLMLGLSTLFTLYIAWLILNKTNSAYAAMAGSFVPITICVIIGAIPIIIYVMIAASFALILSAKLLGVI